MTGKIWRPVLGAAAEQDLLDIIRWTTENFGAGQAATYRDIILSALTELKAGPGVPGARRREEIGPDLLTFNIARRGRRARHFLLIRPRDGQVIEVLRILHASMDIERHVPGQETGPVGDDPGAAGH